MTTTTKKMFLLTSSDETKKNCLYTWMSGDFHFIGKKKIGVAINIQIFIAILMLMRNIRISLLKIEFILLMNM